MTTYEEYIELRHQIGYPADNAMCAEVWNGCTPESQENMLAQLRPTAQAEQERFARHGMVW